MSEETAISLEKLSEDLDSLGLPVINKNVDIVEQLKCGMHRLIQLHRKTVSQLNNTALHTTILNNEKGSYQKSVETTNEKLKSQEKYIIELTETLRKNEYEKDNLKLKKTVITKDLNTLKSMYNNKDLEYGHIVARLKLDNEKLRERLGEDIGKYKNKDVIAVEVINKYKAKEIIFKDTIQKLQNNNTELVGEILNLKEEVLTALCRPEN